MSKHKDQVLDETISLNREASADLRMLLNAFDRWNTLKRGDASAELVQEARTEYLRLYRQIMPLYKRLPPIREILKKHGIDEGGAA